MTLADSNAAVLLGVLFGVPQVFRIFVPFPAATLGDAESPAALC